jgi:hypothetical protein
MNALRVIAQTNFENQIFKPEGSPQSYTVITAEHGTAEQLQLSEHGAVFSEIQRLAASSEAPPLCIVKVMFQRPICDHIFMSTPDDCKALLELFNIDTYALGLVATDFNGFHRFGENTLAQTTSYYLQCTAFKVVWSYSHVTGHIRAIAFCMNQTIRQLHFDEFKTSLKNSGKLLLHPLILPLACLAQTIDSTNHMLRRQYGRCQELENTIGYHHPQRVFTKATEDLGELADMSKQANGLKIQAEMFLRRVKQLAAALEVYGEMEREHQIQGLEGESISNDVSSSIALALSLTKTRLNVMEREFFYVGTRADSLLNAVSCLSSCWSRARTDPCRYSTS